MSAFLPLRPRVVTSGLKKKKKTPPRAPVPQIKAKEKQEKRRFSCRHSRVLQFCFFTWANIGSKPPYYHHCCLSLHPKVPRWLGSLICMFSLAMQTSAVSLHIIITILCLYTQKHHEDKVLCLLNVFFLSYKH